MPIPEIPHIGTHNNMLVEPAAGLADEMLAYYIDWRHDASAVSDAYKGWLRAPATEAASCFAAYMFALDKEEAAATRYAMVVKNLDRALQA